MTSIFKVTVAALLALLLAARYPQAAEPVVITLSCEGTITNSFGGDATHPIHAKPKPIKIGFMVVNLAEQTVSGFNIAARIEKIDAAHISFNTESKLSLGSISVVGELIVSPAVMATTTTKTTSDYYELACKAASRVF